MKPRTLKAKVTQHKMKLTGLVAAIGVFTGLLFAYNFVYNPASSIHFTVYTPPEKSFFSGHLVIPGYKKDSFTVFGTQQAKLGYSTFGDGANIIQERSIAEISCEGIKSCVTKKTKKGQQYSYGLDSKVPVNPRQVAVFKKGDTKITVIRYHDRQFSEDQWSTFIDTLEPISIDQLRRSLYYIYSDHQWSPV